MDIRQVSNKKKYDFASSVYDAIAYLMSLGQAQNIYKTIAKNVNAKKNSTIVELGCGPGSVIPSLLEEVDSSSKITGIDFSCAMIDIANRKKREFNWDNVEFKCMDMYEYTPDKKVDTVIFSLALTAMPEYEKAIEKALDILKPNGQLLIIDSIPLHSKWYHFFTNIYISFKSLIVGAKPVGKILDFLDEKTYSMKSKEMVGGVYILIDARNF
jgi:ubiquinone/menaquinone biosynthesis C-methylase UbiE